MSTVESRYQATASGDCNRLSTLVCVVTAIFGLCNSVRLLQLLVVMIHKWLRAMDVGALTTLGSFISTD
jgi:hypothetical protein